MKKRIILHFSNNWKSALTVALVSIPLAIALTLASGGTPTQGIITAFGAGLLGALLGGSHFNIIGPTGALSGILISYTIIYGGETLPVIAVLSGLIILLLYFLKFDKYIIFIPGSVINGFTLGVAFIIGLGQLDNILGLNNIKKEENILINTLNSLSHISETQFSIFIFFVASLLFILLWNRKFPKVPGAILIALIGIIIVYIIKNFDLSINITTLGDKYPNINGTIFENNYLKYSLNMFFNKKIWLTAVAVAIISILETLLSGKIAQDITKVKFDRQQELFGLAIANIGTGLLGGIPATAALARTALNIKSGAVHRASGLLSAVFVAIIAIFLLNLFTLLPMAVIAAILVFVAIGMIETKHFTYYWKYEKMSFFLSMFVAFTTLVEDPIIGILVGTAISLIIFVSNISTAQTEILLWKDSKMTEKISKKEILKLDKITSDIVAYRITGMLTYINMPAHLETVKKIKGCKHVIISLRSAFYADSDGSRFLKEIIEDLKSHNEKIYLASVSDEIKRFIQHEDFYNNKLLEGRIFDRTSDAINEILGEFQTKKLTTNN